MGQVQDCVKEEKDNEGHLADQKDGCYLDNAAGENDGRNEALTIVHDKFLILILLVI